MVPNFIKMALVSSYLGICPKNGVVQIYDYMEMSCCKPKSPKTFLGRKIFHEKTFWVKRINCDIYGFAANMR